MKQLLDLLFASLYNDAPEHYQVSFQDPASSLGEEIIWFHDKLLFYFILIATVVLWMISQIVLSFRLKNRAISHKYLTHGTVLEIIWTLTPALILVTIAFPSFKLLYLMDEVIDPSITIKVIGFLFDGLILIIPPFIIIIYFLLLNNYICLFNIPNIRANKRIGPHNQDVISVVFGSLLGNAYGNKKIIDGVRISYQQSIIHKEYLDWLYSFFLERGYVSNLLPRLYNRTIKNRELIYQGYEFNTFTFRSFFWLHKCFYYKGKKKLPNKDILNNYLTPLALAIWIMDEGTFVKNGIIIATYNFTLEEHTIIVSILKKKYDINSIIQKMDNKYVIYIKSDSLEKVRKLVDQYIIPSMKYKIGY